MRTSSDLIYETEERDDDFEANVLPECVSAHYGSVVLNQNSGLIC